MLRGLNAARPHRHHPVEGSDRRAAALHHGRQPRPRCGGSRGDRARARTTSIIIITMTMMSTNMSMSTNMTTTMRSTSIITSTTSTAPAAATITTMSMSITTSIIDHEHDGHCCCGHDHDHDADEVFTSWVRKRLTSTPRLSLTRLLPRSAMLRSAPYCVQRASFRVQTAASGCTLTTFRAHPKSAAALPITPAVCASSAPSWMRSASLLCSA